VRKYQDAGVLTTGHRREFRQMNGFVNVSRANGTRGHEPGQLGHRLGQWL
jgi:hypothetical protein